MQASASADYPITRVVRLTMRPGTEDQFMELFATHRKTIAGMPGCLQLGAFRDVAHPSVFFTISQWSSEAALDQYRFSRFFKELWEQVRPLFAAKAEAHSLQPV